VCKWRHGDGAGFGVSKLGKIAAVSQIEGRISGSTNGFAIAQVRQILKEAV